MIKDCSTCDYCQYSKLNNGYVCENEDSPNYGDIDDWIDGCCDKWFDEGEGTKYAMDWTNFISVCYE